MTVSLALFGAGRMAEAFAEQVRQSGDVTLLAIVTRQAPAWIADTDCFRQLDDLPTKPQLLVDFTLPEGTAEAAKWCAANGVSLLSGVTGLGPEQFKAMEHAARSAAVMWSPNLSLGVNLLASLARQVAATLPADSRIQIEDVHHQHKKDAPSGTALMLGEAISAANPAHQPAYSSQRVGEVIGEHEIRFSWAGEEIVLAHAAKDRSVFARGALSAAIWLAKQPVGYYRADDWLSGLGQG